jgi:hypothetical protein
MASRLYVSISSSTNKFHIPNSPLSISLGSRITGINYKRVATCGPLLLAPVNINTNTRQVIAPLFLEIFLKENLR